MSERTRKLNATSYVVLGMLSYAPATSYDLKQFVGNTIGNFWAFAHSQLYDEPARLVRDGLVEETVEEGGRRRRTYSILPAGQDALRAWLASPTTDQTEVRDSGLLKLFFASFGNDADLMQLARDRHQSHRARAEGYVEQRAEIIDYADRWQVKTLELGLRYERCVEQFWADFIEELQEDAPPDPQLQSPESATRARRVERSRPSRPLHTAEAASPEAATTDEAGQPPASKPSTSDSGAGANRAMRGQASAWP